MAVHDRQSCYYEILESKKIKGIHCLLFLWLYKVVKNQESKSVNLNAIGRPTFDEMTSGVYHDCIFSLSVIANLGKWYEDRVITY